MGNGKNIKLKKEVCLYVNSSTPKLLYNDSAFPKAESEVWLIVKYLAKKH